MVTGTPGAHTELKKKGAGGINRDVFVFAFFLFLSFIFWYLNSLGKEAEADVWYPVKYINPPKERSIAVESQDNLNLFLKGPGFSILKIKFPGKKMPVIIDISKVNYKRVPGTHDLDYYIVTSGILKSLALQLRSGCEITSIKPDTLFFTLEKRVANADQGHTEEKAAGNRRK